VTTVQALYLAMRIQCRTSPRRSGTPNLPISISGAIPYSAKDIAIASFHCPTTGLGTVDLAVTVTLTLAATAYYAPVLAPDAVGSDTRAGQ